MRLTGPSPLTETFVELTRPAMSAVTGHDCFRRLGDASLEKEECRRALVRFYPLVAAFPGYMTHVLARVGDGPRSDEIREWLAGNLETEKLHARWWLDWGRPFGLGAQDFEAPSPPSAARQTELLARVAQEAPAASAIAAINYAVEGATGAWTRAVLPAVARLAENCGVALDRRSLRWLRAHARYDDHHPIEALEAVKVLAPDEPSMRRAAAAATESLRYFEAALDELLSA